MPELGRTLATRHVTMITIGGIIGAGLFVGSSTAISKIGPAAILTYALSGLVILFIMRILSELAAAHPGTGSFTEFSRLGLGNWAGFVSGWLYWYFWVIVVPIEAIAGATILQGWAPNVPYWAVSLGLLTVMTGVNLLSTRSFGEFEFWFSSIKVGAIIIFILVAASYAIGLTAPHGATFGNLVSHGGFAPHGALAVLGGVVSVIFAFVGAEIVTVAAAESADPARATAKLTSSVAVRVLLFFVLSIALIVSIVPWNAIQPGHSPFTATLVAIGIPGAATIMNFVVLTAVLSCLNSGIYVTSRVLFGLAAKGDAPQWLVVLNANRVPARAILAGSAFGYAAIAASVLAHDVVFNFLVDASGAIALVLYLLVAVAELRLRAHWQRADPTRLPIRMWFFPYGTWAVIAVMLAVLAAMAVTPASQSEFYSSAVVVAVAVAGYALRRAFGPAAVPPALVAMPPPLSD
jgi:GABA permease